MKHLSLLGLLLFFVAVSCSDDSDVLNRPPEKIPIKLTAPSGLEIAQGSVKSNQLTLNWPPPLSTADRQHSQLHGILRD